MIVTLLAKSHTEVQMVVNMQNISPRLFTKVPCSWCINFMVHHHNSNTAQARLNTGCVGTQSRSTNRYHDCSTFVRPQWHEVPVNLIRPTVWTPFVLSDEVLTSPWLAYHNQNQLPFTLVEPSTFLRTAMNCGTRITGQLRQPTTSLHTWPITWDIKGCLCLFKHHNPKHTPDW